MSVAFAMVLFGKIDVILRKNQACAIFPLVIMGETAYGFFRDTVRRSAVTGFLLSFPENRENIPLVMLDAGRFTL